MHSHPWDSVDVEVLGPLITRRVIHSAAATVAKFELATNATVARHQHVSEQFTTILKGALELEFDDHRTVVRAGEFLVIPSNVPHAARALEDCVVLDYFCPPREDWIRKDDAYLRGVKS